MRRRSKAGGEPVKARTRKAAKRRPAPKDVRGWSASAGHETIVEQLTRERDEALERENARLLNELRHRTADLSESLEQQTATSEVLKVISSSQGELQPVFEAILTNATRICEAKFGNLLLYDGEMFRRVALYNAPAAWAADLQRDPRRTREEAPLLYRLVDTRAIVHIADVLAEAPNETIHRFTGARSLVLMPMFKGDELTGAIGIYRQEVRPFSEKQIMMLKSFGDQAVIAIENARLLNELRRRTDDLSESLEQQTATSKVLEVISSSPGVLKPVFEANFGEWVQGYERVEAFGWAVHSFRLYDWNPADPDRPRFQVNGDSLTFREICERAKKLDEPLPEVIKYDLYPLLGRAPDLQAKLRLNETYSVAAAARPRLVQ